jgi:hypothetical protein
MPVPQPLLPFATRPRALVVAEPPALLAELRAFTDFGTPTRELVTETAAGPIPTFVNEFWTRQQRAASSLHEISYRACFKPQLPRFFIERLTRPGARVHDPFMGRGTTVLEAALLGRAPSGCDVNPLSAMLVEPRLAPPELAAIETRLDGLDLRGAVDDEELLVFFHPQTLAALTALRAHLLERERAGALDAVDRWIRMVAVNRLTGHSPGFFSVYTLPPNQAVGVERQRKINRDRGQAPPLRDVRALIVRKSRSLLADCTPAVRERLRALASRARALTAAAHATAELDAGSVALVVTSPPFLDVVQYAADNWLRCWFCGIDAQQVPITIARRVEDWQAAMREVFVEQRRLLAPGGWIAFEVGEVRGGKVRLEEAVVPCAAAAGLEPVAILIHDQRFTKTANCWGIDNNAKGTNSNRIVLLRRG